MIYQVVFEDEIFIIKDYDDHEIIMCTSLCTFLSQRIMNVRLSFIE